MVGTICANPPSLGFFALCDTTSRQLPGIVKPIEGANYELPEEYKCVMVIATFAALMMLFAPQVAGFFAFPARPLYRVAMARMASLNSHEGRSGQGQSDGWVPRDVSSRKSPETRSKPVENTRWRRPPSGDVRGGRGGRDGGWQGSVKPGLAGALRSNSSLSPFASSSSPSRVVWNKGEGGEGDSRRANHTGLAASGSPNRRRKVRKVDTFADVVTQPDNFYRTLSYDHLATNSLRCIETMPHFRFDKGDSYLRKWWFVCKKWGLLTGELRRLDEALTLRNNVLLARAGSMEEEARTAAVSAVEAANSTAPLPELYSSCEGRQARIICIGDVHGCVMEVCDLLRSVNYHPGDLVVFLGDLVAKGPDSGAVVRLAMELGALSVRGNHDHEVVRQGVTFRRRQGKYRRQSVRKVAATEHEHLRVALDLNLREFNWLAQLPYYMCSVDLGTLFVHAGFQHKVKLMEQDPWVMMTMRSLLPDGRVSARCIYTQPWADHWGGPLTVLFGHDAARGLQRHDHAVGLDTGCVYGGNLTAMILPERRLVSVPARETYSDYINSRSHKTYISSKDRGSDGERVVLGSGAAYLEGNTETEMDTERGRRGEHVPEPEPVLPPSAQGGMQS